VNNRILGFGILVEKGSEKRRKDERRRDERFKNSQKSKVLKSKEKKTRIALINTN
jgi:hypothetical protein